jgi:septal ring factor EnvC (AmiA/AmiB activator)
MDDAKADFNKARRRRENLESELATLEKQIESLREENEEVDEKLRKRETDLYKYRFKIKDLNKSKQVLTHRTYEMRANLAPKDA